MSYLIEWFDDNIKLIADQIKEKDKSIDFTGQTTFLLGRKEFMPLIAKGLQEFILKTPIYYISAIDTGEVGCMVLLDSGMKNFHSVCLYGE